MIIRKPASAGTLESSDCMVTVLPADGGRLELEIESPVLAQYGDAIRQTAERTLRELSVEGGAVRIQDKGALDCVIAARVETAVLRAAGETGGVR